MQQSLDDQDSNKQVKGKRNKNQEEIKNQRITRRMKKIIKKNQIAFFDREEEKCAICLSQCQRSSATLPCQHVFCMGCIANWWINNSTCPYCRQSFDFVFDYKGRRLRQDELPKDLLIEREETLKCEVCWADIGDEPMRICFECRCVYIHKRCMNGEEFKMKWWYCEECYDNQEEELEKIIDKEERKGPSYLYYFKTDPSLTQRQSQRISQRMSFVSRRDKNISQI